MAYNYIRTINVVGGRNADPASLKTRLEPMKLEDNMGIAAKFIAFGEVANMTGEDCEFQIEDMTYSKNVNLKIPEGRYRRREDVLFAICHVIDKYVNNNADTISTSIEVEQCTTTITDLGKFTITPPRNINVNVNARHGIWSIIKVYENSGKIPSETRNIIRNKQVLHVFTGDLEERTGMAFIYINIAENSYINGKKSRVLTAFPVSSKSGYSYHEFSNTTYFPIAVNEFSDIEIELRDVTGKLLKIDNSYDTIVSMHISPINRRN